MGRLPRDRDPIGDDLEVVELVTDERESPARGREPEGGDKDRSPRRRRLLALALAIAVAVVAIAGVSVAVSRDDGDAEAGRGNRDTSNAPPPTARDVVADSTTIPPDERLPVTIPGDASTTAPLLPEGAPSTPHVGELVVSAWRHIPGFSSRYYLYADGRLIRWAEAGSGGEVFEQRLAPEGVERVRSEFLASGRFNPTQPGTLSGCTEPLCVRGDDGRLLSALQSAVGADHLVSYISTLASSLPESEWATPRLRRYVASRFNVCVVTYANLPDRAIPVQVDLSTVLSAFPTEAAQLFGSREAHDGGGPPCSHVFEKTLEEARALANVFLSPTGGGTHEYSGIVIRNAELATIQSDRSDGIVAYISFQPLLPDGVLP